MNPVIVAALRTPIGTAGHALAGVTASELAAAVLQRLSAEVGQPDEVVLGNCMGPGGDVARVAALTADLPETVPALTVDRQCASGLSAIALACALVRNGAARVFAGGTESPSTAPWRYWPPTPERPEPERYTRAPFAPADRDVEMPRANDKFAAAHQITRNAQDDYAARSHARAVAAQQAGAFDNEIVAVAGVSTDERPRPNLSAQRLSRFPLLHPDLDHATMTAGNSCGINDGAAAVAVVSGADAAARNLPGLEVLAHATTGHSPSEPGAGLIAASQQALEGAGLAWADVDVIEFNEAFAGQVLACCAVLGIDPQRVSPQGGAIALGHPWGASGAVLMVRLFHQLLPTPGRIGLAAISAGGGQGVAMVVRSTGSGEPT